jgi:hypothetical protein
LVQFGSPTVRRGLIGADLLLVQFGSPTVRRGPIGADSFFPSFTLSPLVRHRLFPFSFGSYPP